MKLLFDQNLSHRLVTSLEDVFPGSQHIRSAGLAEADDLAIWEYAAAHRFVIVTQDSDYADWNKLRGAPPLIVWLRCGNASTSQIHQKLSAAADRIAMLESQPHLELEVVEVW